MDTVISLNQVKVKLMGNCLEVDGKQHPSTVRIIGQMKDVLLTPDSTYSEPLYYMYRGVSSREDLRYDVTLILPRMLKDEYAKTFGHYHPQSPDGLEYPEVYQVISGEARFILQKKNKDESADVIVVTAIKGDCVVFPSGYGHVSVNASATEPLLLANIVYEKFESDYSEYKKLHGAAIYYTKDGPVQNTNYIVKKIEHLTAKELNKRYGFMCQDLLVEFLKNPKKFEFLKIPKMMFTE